MSKGSVDGGERREGTVGNGEWGIGNREQDERVCLQLCCTCGSLVVKQGGVGSPSGYFVCTVDTYTTSTDGTAVRSISLDIS
jgi:hypothetical protein